MVLFKDSELMDKADQPKESVEDVYRVTLAAKQASEREEIANKLRKQGIQTIPCEPEQLSLEVINKYMELKSRGII